MNSRQLTLAPNRLDVKGINEIGEERFINSIVDTLGHQYYECYSNFKEQDFDLDSALDDALFETKVAIITKFKKQHGIQ